MGKTIHHDAPKLRSNIAKKTILNAIPIPDNLSMSSSFIASSFKFGYHIPCTMQRTKLNHIYCIIFIISCQIIMTHQWLVMKKDYSSSSFFTKIYYYEAMNKIIIKYGIYTTGWLAILYPLFIRAQNVSWSLGQNEPALLFPFFGLLMTSLLWLHAISGAFEPWLRKYISFDQFVHLTASVILISIIAHPLLLLVSLDFNINNVFIYYGTKYIWLAIIAWLLLIIYDIGKALKKYNFFIKNWNNILIISNIGFLITFFHSLEIGSDLQSGPLRIVWIFYGITATLAIIYTYGIKKFLK